MRSVLKRHPVHEVGLAGRITAIEECLFRPLTPAEKELEEASVLVQALCGVHAMLGCLTHASHCLPDRRLRGASPPRRQRSRTPSSSFGMSEHVVCSRGAPAQDRGSCRCPRSVSESERVRYCPAGAVQLQDLPFWRSHTGSCTLADIWPGCFAR